MRRAILPRKMRLATDSSPGSVTGLLMTLGMDFGDLEATDPSLPAIGAPLSSVWATRRARALQLVSEAPAAEEVLSTYADLVQVQARAAERVPVQLWLALVSAEAGPPKLRFDRLPVDELVPLFLDFLADTAQLGNDLVRSDAGALSGTPGAGWLALFSAALAPEAPEEDGPFHVRAFLQSVATALAASEADTIETAQGGRCLVCGGAPVVGVLGDLPGAHDGRSLVCGVCGTVWRVPRPACARCGEDGRKTLGVRSSPSLPWVRVDVCESCGCYMKSVDMRRRNDAVPMVDDLATPDLDRWAREQGLTRAHQNLFGR